MATPLSSAKSSATLSVSGFVDYQEDPPPAYQIHLRLARFVLQLNQTSDALTQDELYELGINSEDEQIFSYSLARLLILKKKHFAPLLRGLLLSKTLSALRRKLIYEVYVQLYSLDLPDPQKLHFLARVLSQNHQKLSLGLIRYIFEELARIADQHYLHLLIRFQNKDYRALVHYVKIRLGLNTKTKDQLHRAFEAMFDSDHRIREHALEILTSLDSTQARDFLLRYAEQNNLVAGKFTYDQVQKALQKHKKNYPHLYRP